MEPNHDPFARYSSARPEPDERPFPHQDAPTSCHNGAARRARARAVFQMIMGTSAGHLEAGPRDGDARPRVRGRLRVTSALRPREADPAGSENQIAPSASRNRANDARARPARLEDPLPVRGRHVRRDRGRQLSARATSDSGTAAPSSSAMAHVAHGDGDALRRPPAQLRSQLPARRQRRGVVVVRRRRRRAALAQPFVQLRSKVRATWRARGPQPASHARLIFLALSIDSRDRRAGLLSVLGPVEAHGCFTRRTARAVAMGPVQQ